MKIIVRLLASISVLLAIGAVALLAAGPLGYRLNWWHYRVGFQDLMPWAAYVGIAAVAAAVLTIVSSLLTGIRILLKAAALALIAGAIATYMPWQANNMRGIYPSINDITTDMADPPRFVAALPLRKADGGSSLWTGRRT